MTTRRTTLFSHSVASVSIDEPLAEFIAKLQAFDQSGDNARIYISQMGDSWDGYGECEVEIYRDATPEEAAEQERQERAEREERQRLQDARNRAAYEQLKAMYGE